MKSFKLLVCGCSGGPKENNLSCYLLSPYEKEEYIALDAGTLLSGIELAFKKGHLKEKGLKGEGYTPSGLFLRNHVVAYLISHAHLDHVLGLIINSQSDASKAVLARDLTIETLKEHLFNGVVWPNFANEGSSPLNLYEYHRLPLYVTYPIPKSSMTVETFPLSHDQTCESAAFLIEQKGAYLLYLGDTAPDVRASEGKLRRIWEKVAPLVREKKLKGILLECSYPQGSSGAGGKFHLDSETFRGEMDTLAQLAGSLKNLPVVVTHRKQTLAVTQDPFKQIEKELKEGNTHGIQFIFPTQGDVYSL